MEHLLQLMKTLRQSCPWDRAQTPESLTKYAIEEAYEVEDAILKGDPKDVCNELGDLLLQVVFQAELYSEQGLFNFDDVVNAICEKLIRRHPHIFEAEKHGSLSAEEVSTLWQTIKKQEKQNQYKDNKDQQHQEPSLLDQVKHGPAVAQAEQLQTVAASIGFDFENIDQAYEKLEEELSEFKHEWVNQDSDKMFDEFGDCLFSFINVGRKMGIDSERALLKTINKFKARFHYIEEHTKTNNKQLQQLSLAEMDQLWDQAKLHFRQQDSQHDIPLPENSK